MEEHRIVIQHTDGKFYDVSNLSFDEARERYADRYNSLLANYWNGTVDLQLPKRSSLYVQGVGWLRVVPGGCTFCCLYRYKGIDEENCQFASSFCKLTMHLCFAKVRGSKNKVCTSNDFIVLEMPAGKFVSAHITEQFAKESAQACAVKTSGTTFVVAKIITECTAHTTVEWRDTNE